MTTVAAQLQDRLTRPFRLLCLEFDLGDNQKRDISFGDRMVEAPSQAQGTPPVLEAATARREARDT
jgi:hypothetical protein